MRIRQWKQVWLPALVLVVVAVGCTAPVTQPSGGNEARPRTPKRITAAILGEPPALGLGDFATSPGRQELELLLNAGLSVTDNRGGRQARLAEAVPSLENGLWTVFPDGRMETVWHIKPAAQWHDGAPFTADDLVFTTVIEQDRELGRAVNPVYASIDRVEAPDPYTVRVTWKKPFLWADSLFGVASSPVASPRPKHLLEKPSTENKDGFLGLPYWRQEFIGTGPYRLREWVAGSHALLEANDQFVLGRPKIDEIGVKFITDQSTIIANLLAGAVDVTITRGLSLEQGLQLRDQWKEGNIETAPANPIAAYPQFMPPTPPVMGDVRFRRALLHAVDRQGLVDSLMHGLSSVADAPSLSLSAPEYTEVEASIVRYAYDPRRAAQLLEGMGLTKGSDGFYRDTVNEKVSVEIGSDPQTAKAMLAVADFWQRVGISTQPVEFPALAIQDREWRAIRSFIYLQRSSLSLDNLNQYFHSSGVPLAERNFTGSNFSRYANGELDALIDRYGATIPRAERNQVLGQIIHHVSDQVVVLGFYYDIGVTAAAKRLTNVTARTTFNNSETWNAHEWDMS